MGKIYAKALPSLQERTLKIMNSINSRVTGGEFVDNPATNNLLGKGGKKGTKCDQRGKLCFTGVDRKKFSEKSQFLRPIVIRGLGPG